MKANNLEFVATLIKKAVEHGYTFDFTEGFAGFCDQITMYKNKKVCGVYLDSCEFFCDVKVGDDIKRFFYSTRKKEAEAQIKYYLISFFNMGSTVFSEKHHPNDIM